MSHASYSATGSYLLYSSILVFCEKNDPVPAYRLSIKKESSAADWVRASSQECMQFKQFEHSFSALSNEQSELGCPNFDSVYTTCWETIFGSLLFNNVMWRGYWSVSLAQCEKVFILYLITVHVDMKNYSVQHAQRHSLCSYGTKAPYATGRMLKSQYLYHSLRGMISLTNRNKAPG